MSVASTKGISPSLYTLGRGSLRLCQRRFSNFHLLQSHSCSDAAEATATNKNNLNNNKMGFSFFETTIKMCLHVLRFLLQSLQSGSVIPISRCGVAVKEFSTSRRYFDNLNWLTLICCRIYDKMRQNLRQQSAHLFSVLSKQLNDGAPGQLQLLIRHRDEIVQSGSSSCCWGVITI